MTNTPKYNLEPVSRIAGGATYGLKGWAAAITANVAKLDAAIQTRLPVLVAGEAISKYDAVYLNAANGRVYRAQADGSQQPCIGLAVEDADTGEEIRVQREGAITNVGWSWTCGDEIYLSGATPGGLQSSAPAGNAQVLGYALAATVIVLERQPVEVAAAVGVDLTQMVIVREENSGDGGTFTSGAWRTRVLNTSHYNGISGASLASNQLTLPAGTYLAEWSAPAFDVNRHVTRLFNVTDSAVVDIGTSEMAAAVQTVSLGRSVFTLAASKALRLDHYCQTTKNTLGFGVDNPNVTNNVYTVLAVSKIG